MYLEINNLYKGFGEADSRVEVLKDISFGVEKGEICVMLGPSGSGKSTLLNIVGGIESADSGSVRVGEDELEAMNEKKLSGYLRLPPQASGLHIPIIQSDRQFDGQGKYRSRRISDKRSAAS